MSDRMTACRLSFASNCLGKVVLYCLQQPLKTFMFKKGFSLSKWQIVVTANFYHMRICAINREIIYIHAGRRGKGDEDFDKVFQLANITGPMIIFHHSDGIGFEINASNIILFRDFFDKMSCKQWNIIRSLTEGWNLHGDKVQPIE